MLQIIKKILFLLSKLVIGISILSFLFYKIGSQDIVEILGSIQFVYLIPSLIFLALNMVLNTFGLKYISKLCDKNIGFGRMFKYYFMMWTISLFVPGLFGQLSLIFFLKKEGMSWNESSAVCILDKAITLSFVLLMAYCGFFLFLPLNQAILLTSIISSISIISVFLLIHFKRNRIISTILPKQVNEGINQLCLISSKYRKNKQILIITILTTISKWVAKSLFIFFIFKSVHQSILWIYILIINSIETLVSSIPITLSGLGLREMTGSILYPKVGGELPKVIGMYLVLLIMTYSIMFIGLFFINWKDLKWNVASVSKENNSQH